MLDGGHLSLSRQHMNTVCRGRSVAAHPDMHRQDPDNHSRQAQKTDDGARNGQDYPRRPCAAHRVAFPIIDPTVVNYAPIRSGLRSTRRSSCAFSATTIVDRLISTAPAAGESTMPAKASTPAASGTARTL